MGRRLVPRSVPTPVQCASGGRCRHVSVSSRRLRPLLLPVCCLLVLGYFAYHAVEGDYGLFALGKLQDRVASLEAELATARAEREQMERHVALMRPESLDRDMIDERAREALNMADAKDIVIFLDPRADRAPTR